MGKELLISFVPRQGKIIGHLREVLDADEDETCVKVNARNFIVMDFYIGVYRVGKKNGTFLFFSPAGRGSYFHFSFDQIEYIKV